MEFFWAAAHMYQHLVAAHLGSSGQRVENRYDHGNLPLIMVHDSPGSLNGIGHGPLVHGKHFKLCPVLILLDAKIRHHAHA